jgi:hypothetical protein
MACAGVDRIYGLDIVARGCMYLEGSHAVRPRELRKRLEAKGARLRPEFSGSTQLLLLGELMPHQLHDDRIGGVDALEQLWRTRRDRGPHVHLVHTSDLGALLRGELVPCRRVSPYWEDMKKRLRTSTRRGHL